MSWLPNSPNVSPFPRQATFATFMIYIALMSANVNFFETCPFFSSILECMMTFLIICYQLIIYPFRLVSQLSPFLPCSLLKGGHIHNLSKLYLQTHLLLHQTVAALAPEIELLISLNESIRSSHNSNPLYALHLTYHHLSPSACVFFVPCVLCLYLKLQVNSSC